MIVKKLQMGGPAPEAAPQGGAPAPEQGGQAQGGGPEEQIAAMAQQIVEQLGPEAAAMLAEMIMQMLQGAGGGRSQSRLPADGVRICASESGAGQVAAPGGTAAGISVEQLSGLSGAAGAARGVAAGGAGFGGGGDSLGQRCGAQPVRADDGRAAGAGRPGGLRADSAGLVLGRGGVSQGVAGAGEGASWGVALRRGVAGKRTGESGGAGAGWVARAGLDP